MSIVMDRVVESYGFDRRGGGCIFPADPPAKLGGAIVAGGAGRWVSPLCSTSSSSSIGVNSDDEEEDGGKSSPEGGDFGENEAESPYKGPLDMMDSLEEVLPMRRGISRFYNGKSRSFTSLVEETSMKDVAKPENPYSRRRRNLLSHHHRRYRCGGGGGGISKKPIVSTVKCSLALAMAEMTKSGEDTSSSSSESSPRLPPLHPRREGYFDNFPGGGGGFCAWRSYSVVDFPRWFPAAAGGGSGDS